MKKVKWIALISLTGLVALIPLGSMALAQTTQPTQPTPNYPSWVNEMEDYCHGAGGMMGGWGGGGYGSSTTSLGNPVTLQRIAGVLGTTLDDLQTRLSRGETIAQIAQSKNVDTKLVVAALLAPENEILQVRVKYGYLSQALAQAIMEQSRLWAEQTLQVPNYGSYYPRTTPGSTGGGYYPGYGSGGGMMGGGMMGSGWGWGGRGMMGR